MMLNLFTIFDPSSSPYYSLNWLSVMVSIFFIPMNYFLIPSLTMSFMMELYNKMYSEMNVFLKCQFSSMMFSILMCYMLSYNFMGLFPYVFTITSHLVFTLSFALSFWFAYMLYGWYNFSENMLAHLVPLGTPSILMPFMVLIESVSLLIRPVTLSVRLAANMIAGHLLLCLVGSTSFSLIIIFIVFLTQLCLYFLESGVSFIQAYVFSVLSSLYSSDVEFYK